MNKKLFLITGFFVLFAIAYLMLPDTEKPENPPVLKEEIHNQVKDTNKPIKNKESVALENEDLESKDSEVNTSEVNTSEVKIQIKKSEQLPKSVLTTNAEKVILNPKHAGIDLPEFDPPPGSVAGNKAGIASPPPTIKEQQKPNSPTNPLDTSLPPYEINDIPTDRIK